MPIVTPDGRRLDDGFPTAVVFSLDENLGIWSKDTQPFGVDGGDPIPTTTMLSTALDTFDTRKLYNLTRGTSKCAYDEGMLLRILAMVNKNQTITYRFPSGRTWSLWAYMKSFIPDALVMHQQPTANIEVVPTNQNIRGQETGPWIGTWRALYPDLTVYPSLTLYPLG